MNTCKLKTDKFDHGLLITINTLDTIGRYNRQDLDDNKGLAFILINKKQVIWFIFFMSCSIIIKGLSKYVWYHIFLKLKRVSGDFSLWVLLNWYFPI